MERQVLSEGHEQQIINMCNDGKKAKEIIGWFEEKYRIKLEPWKISYIKAKQHSRTTRKTRQRQGKKKEQPNLSDCEFKAICRYAKNCQPEICRYKQ